MDTERDDSKAARRERQSFKRTFYTSDRLGRFMAAGRAIENRAAAAESGKPERRRKGKRR